MLTLTWN